MTKLSIQPFSREYYKQRHQTVRKPVNQKTECCGQDIDHDVLNKSNPKDWEMMLNHCEDHLDQYPSTETRARTRIMRLYVFFERRIKWIHYQYGMN